MKLCLCAGRAIELRYERRAVDEQVTGLLQAWSGGDASALELLTPIIYSELYRLARVQMAGERSGHILQPSHW